MHSLLVNRILIYRLGSIGDFVVSLPCLHLIRQNFPATRICLLTSREPDSRAATAETVLLGSGLVDEYIEYPLATRSLTTLRAVRGEVRRFSPDLLVYLAAPRGMTRIWRDYLFFRGCGIKRNVGFPFTRDLRRIRPPGPGHDLWEREANRLARCLSELGEVDIEQRKNWELGLTEAELSAADAALATLQSDADRLISMSIGTKQAIKDWGNANWRRLLEGLSDPTIGLVLIGSKEDYERSGGIASVWDGPVLNLCGQLSPRSSAAVIRRTSVFLCHDSGPMHLAAAVGTLCVAVFCNHMPPGIWFPCGNHQIFYPPAGSSIAAISPTDVCASALALMKRAAVGEGPVLDARSSDD